MLLLVTYDGVAKLETCAVYRAGKTVSADFACNPDFTASQAGVITRVFVISAGISLASQRVVRGHRKRSRPWLPRRIYGAGNVASRGH